MNKNIARTVFSALRLPLDAIFALLAIPSGIILRTYRRIGSARLPLTTNMLRRLGVFPIRSHYFEPLFDFRSLPRDPAADRFLPGLRLNVEGQLAFQRDFRYSQELIDLRLEQPSDAVENFYIDNGSFKSGDAEFLYQFLRAVRPAKVIEIGSGNSTRIARLALKRTAEETGEITTHICIEPYEASWLERLGGMTVVRKRLEDCAIDWSSELGPGDLLFVDSSHMIRPQGDVLLEYLEVFPQLASGVYIHIHDIFTPKDYPKEWMERDVWFWNEQYLLEALLSNTDRYEVLGTLNHLKHHHYDHLKQICPYLTPSREPGSFYLRVR